MGVGSLSGSGDAIEYRFVVHHAQKPETNWAYSDKLIDRPADRPFDEITLSLPGGDSVVLGLHDLTRGGSRHD